MTAASRALACVLALAAAPLRAGDDETARLVRELQAEIARLTSRVGDLEAALAGRPAAAPATVAASTAVAASAQAQVTPAVQPPPVEPPAHVVEAGGRVKLDAIWNSESVGGASGTNRNDLALVPGAVPVAGNGEDGQTSFSARQSRLWAKGRSTTPWGELGGYVEVDFFSNDGSGAAYEPRLRHAYATLSGATFGQTYTTLLNVAAYPELNDDNGPVGILNVRQPLLRWTQPLAFGDLHVALEDPESALVDGTGARVAPDDDRVPDLAGRLDVRSARGVWSVAVIARQARADGAVVAGVDDGAWGGALGVSGRLAIAGPDNLRFSLAYGNALGRYMSFGTFPDGTIDAAGAVELRESAGGFVALQHWWSTTWRSTVAAGYGWMDADGAVPAKVTHTAGSTHANLLWSPVLEATLGIEWIHAWRALADNADGVLDRLQLTALYKF